MLVQMILLQNSPRNTEQHYSRGDMSVKFN